MDAPRSTARNRVFTLRHGTRSTRRSDVFLQYASYGEPDGPHVVDYYFWAIVTGEGVILVDTGFDGEVARRRDRVVLHDPIDMLREHLGVEPDDVEAVVVTHTHYDHIGNLHRFPRAVVHLAEAELAFVRGGALGHRLAGLFHEPIETAVLDAVADAGRLRLVSGEQTIAPGVRLIPVGGHTPGMLMVEVDTAAGAVLLASDALHFFEELERDMPFTSSMDLPATYEAFASIRERTASGGVHLVPGHDERSMEAMTAVDRDVAVLG